MTRWDLVLSLMISKWAEDVLLKYSVLGLRYFFSFNTVIYDDLRTSYLSVVHVVPRCLGFVLIDEETRWEDGAHGGAEELFQWGTSTGCVSVYGFSFFSRVDNCIYTHIIQIDFAWPRALNDYARRKTMTISHVRARRVANDPLTLDYDKFHPWSLLKQLPKWSYKAPDFRGLRSRQCAPSTRQCRASRLLSWMTMRAKLSKTWKKHWLLWLASPGFGKSCCQKMGWKIQMMRFLHQRPWNCSWWCWNFFHPTLWKTKGWWLHRGTMTPGCLKSCFSALAIPTWWT